MNPASSGYHALTDAVLDPSRRLDQSAWLVVVAAGHPARQLGRAYLAGCALDGGQEVATYRLVIDGDELSGLFIRVGRRFDRHAA